MDTENPLFGSNFGTRPFDLSSEEVTQVKSEKPLASSPVSSAPYANVPILLRRLSEKIFEPTYVGAGSLDTSRKIVSARENKGMVIGKPIPGVESTPVVFLYQRDTLSAIIQTASGALYILMVISPQK